MENKFFKIRCKYLSEVANKIHELFGPQAIVISTQEVREKGIRGWLGQKTYEVTVSVPEQTLSEERKKSIAEKKYLEHSTYTTSSTEDETKKKKIEEFERIIRETQQRLKQKPITGSEITAPQKAKVSGETETPVVPFPKEKLREATPREDIVKALREIRELLQVMSVETTPSGIPQEIIPFYKDLVQQGMSKRLSADLIHSVLQNMSMEHARDPKIFIERLALELRKRITTTKGIPVCSGVPRWVVFCGPTGVGKTTSLAKISAHYAIHEKVRVAMASTDTYRVGATEQLKIYAQIIGVPLKIIDDKKTAWETMHEYSQYDLVFLDTAGNSPFNTRQVKELHEILQIIKPYETILVLGAHTPLEDLRYSVAGFSSLKPTSLVFTKLDETRRFGSMISLILETGLPVGYLTHGQNVPDDFTLATPGGIVELLIEGKRNRG